MTSPTQNNRQPLTDGESAGGVVLPSLSAREIDHGTLGPQWVLDEIGKASK